MGRKKLTPIEVRPLPTRRVQSARGSTRPSGGGPTRSLPGASSAMRQGGRWFAEPDQVDQGAGHQERDAKRHGDVKGIGGRLLRAAEDWGHRLGAEFALLEYHAANTRASLFYQESMGYRLASITVIKRL